ncbi:hypothetical protein [uncultured Phycicoccus sp.]|uniref:hypothetical protein n=1 Tax=uncultured Phycicoccus sp. TaxID=661422 RepID=UPI00260E9758|nr:hypothetical protein [uncultured Phycicoccus sp.]
MRAHPRFVALLGGATALLLTQVAPSGAAAGSSDPATVTGVLVAQVADDFARDRSATELAVRRDGDGRAVPLVGLGRDDVAALVGRRVRARGTTAAGGAIRAKGSGVAAAGPSGSASASPDPIEQAAATTAGPTGPRSVKVLAVAIRFADDPSAATPSTSGVSARLFSGSSSVKGYYADVSDGLWTVSGKVVGPYTVSRPAGGGCTSADYYSWANAAVQAAADRGVDTGAYTHYMVVLPPGSVSCVWAGLGQVPGNVTWVNESTPSVYVMAHELGHNFGEGHASTYRCTVDGTKVALGRPSQCAKVSEYGDPFSVMGGTVRLHHATARHHYLLIAPRTLSPGEARTVRLAPADSTSGVRELRVDRGDGTWLSVEYRRPTGVFDTFAGNDPVVTGVTVRVDNGAGVATYLVDSRPSTTSATDAPLQVGGSIVDPLTGSRITLLRADPSGASVSVTSGTAVTGLAVGHVGATVTAWWQPPAGVTVAGYDVAVDHGTPERVVATRWSGPVTAGWHTVSVRAVAADGTRYPWSSASVLARGAVG